MSSLVDRIGFGGGTMIAEGYGAVDEDAGRAAVDAAFVGGIRFFDTAHFYGSGRSELIVGEVLADRRDQITLCTKGGVRYDDPNDLRTLRCDSSYDALQSFMAESLERLRTDHVDYYLLHQFDPALSPEAQMENLARLRDEGLAKEVGFCNFGVEAASRAMATGIPTVVEYSFSLLDHRYLNELTEMKRRGGHRITFGSYAHGLLAERFAPDHEFDATDWRGRSRRDGTSGTSGNVFFAGDAFARNTAIAERIGKIADAHGLPLATFVLALTLREPHSDTALVGCRNPTEVADALAAANTVIDDDTAAAVAAILADAERPSTNTLGT